MEQLTHEMPGIAASPYTPLSDADVRKIADDAFEVLERSGMVVYSPTAFEASKTPSTLIRRLSLSTRGMGSAMPCWRGTACTTAPVGRQSTC